MNLASLKPGDIVFFGGTFEKFAHAGIYAGGGVMWDTPEPGETVRRDPLWPSGFDGAVRYWH
jgi:cell wall-associated NlpC family hydrolase